jgi:hypothetical protein
MCHRPCTDGVVSNAHDVVVMLDSEIIQFLTDLPENVPEVYVTTSVGTRETNKSEQMLIKENLPR